MPRKWKSSIILLLAVWLPAGELAAVDVHSVQQRYARHKDFQGVLHPAELSGPVNKEIIFNGSLYYKRPDRARMDVTSPQRQQIITLKGSSVTVTLFDEGTQAIQEVPREIASQNILAFIAGLGSIERDYSVQESSDHSGPGRPRTARAPSISGSTATTWSGGASTIMRGNGAAVSG